MTLKSRLFSLIAVTLAMVAFSTLGMAQDTTTATPNSGNKFVRPNRGMGRGMGPGRQGMMRRGGGIGMMLRGLDLTDDQKTQIQGILASNKPAQDNSQEMRTLRMAQRNGILTAAQQERLTAIRTAAKAKGQSVHDQILAVLTPEQKTKLDARKQAMQQRMQQWKQNKPAATGTTPPAKNN
jgi:Spy/CpxP family protein refolding chaperone